MCVRCDVLRTIPTRRLSKATVSCVLLTVIVFTIYVLQISHITTENSSCRMTNNDPSLKSFSKTGSDIDTVQANRLNGLKKVCTGNEYSYTGNDVTLVKEHILVDVIHNFTYCAVEKTGSTLWRRIMMILSGTVNTTNPYDIEPFQAFSSGYKSLAQIEKMDLSLPMPFKTNVIFSREPFSRLFSGYVDKLLGTNVGFWGYVGKHVVKYIRGIDNHCGHDVTFREFVKFFIYSQTENIQKNPHFMPVYEICHPCHYQYNVVGKMSTLKDDAGYVFKRLGVKYYHDILNNINHKEKIRDSIFENTLLLFLYNRQEFTKCNITFHEAQRRNWKKLQAQGVISKFSKFPFSEQESSNIQSINFQRALEVAIRDAMNQTISGRMTKEAMAEAYSSVDQEDIKKLQKIFQPDCDLFGYDCQLHLPYMDNNFSYFDTNDV